MFNNEHINEEGLCYCGSLDCIGHVRAMLASMTADRNDTMQQLATAHADLTKAEAVLEDVKRDWAKADQEHYARLNAKVAEISKLQANWSKVKDELQQYVDQGDFDLDGDTMHQFLFDEFELTLIEEVEVKFIIEVSASVKRPKGEDVNEYDFSLDDVSISVADSDWDIEITDYSFTDVDEA